MLILVTSGCVTQEQIQAAKDYQREAVRRLANVDIQIRMGERANALYPAVHAAYVRAYNEGKQIISPKPMSTVTPIYPGGAQLKLAQGVVWVAFVVGPDGGVVEAQALVDEGAPVDPSFIKSATDAVKCWKFHPGTMDGVPTSFGLYVPVSFQLRL